VLVDWNPFFGLAGDDDGGEVSTPVVEVGLIALVEGNDQQRALKGRTGGQRHDDIALQPGIGLGEAAVVRVVINSPDFRSRVSEERAVSPEIRNLVNFMFPPSHHDEDSDANAGME
jgi:hypothetical protein